MQRPSVVVSAALATLLGAATVASAADEFKQVLSIVAKSFKEVRKTMASTLKSGKFPPDGPARNLDDAQREVARTFLDVCDGKTRLGFPDASHWVDVKSLRDERWAFGDKALGVSVAPDGATVMLRASWTASKGGQAADLSVTVAELRQAEYTSGGRKERTTSFADPDREVSNADFAALLQASADAWCKTTAGATAAAPAKKKNGVADWTCTASLAAAEGVTPARRDWCAWETPGVSWRVDGTTWVATICYSDSAAADPKASAAAAALLKQIRPVIE